MEALNFRYTEDINVTICRSFDNINIIFKNQSGIYSKVIYRKHFHGIEFNYSIFSSNSLMLDYVKSTAKDGSAFLARVYKNGRFYAIRKKKRKPQIIFAKSICGGFKNFQLGKDVTDVVCYLNGAISRDNELINDFFEKRQPKDFDEEKYINSLDPEEKKEYLDEKKIEEIVERIGKKNKIERGRIEDLIFYIECMPDDSEIRTKVIKSDNPDEIASVILPLLKKAKEYSKSIEELMPSSHICQDKEYTIDSKYIYNQNLDSLKIDLKDDEKFVEELYFFFEDEYEQIKEYLNVGIERVKKTIDKVLPFFKQYLKDSV